MFGEDDGLEERGRPKEKPETVPALKQTIRVLREQCKKGDIIQLNN